MKEKNMLELLPDNLYIQYGFAILYTAILIALLIWAIKKGSQVAKVTPKEYVTKSTDEVFLKGLHEEDTGGVRWVTDDANPQGNGDR